jgi:two-component system response regulator HydG
VRELENAIERGVVLARGEVLVADDLLLDPAPAEAEGAARDGAKAERLQDFLDLAAAERIRAALAEAGGVRLEAARRLGVDRTTLYRLMRRLGLE